VRDGSNLGKLHSQKLGSEQSTRAKAIYSTAKKSVVEKLANVSDMMNSNAMLIVFTMKIH